MSKAEMVTVSDIIQACTEDGEWVNGEFEAVVKNTTAGGGGKKPSTADLCDPYSPNIKIKASWFGGGDFNKFEGALCLFGGQGMKAKIYKNENSLQMGEKFQVNIQRAAPESTRGPASTPPPQTPAGQDRGPSHSTVNHAPRANTLTKEESEIKFHNTLKKIALLYTHADQYVTDMETKRGIIFPPDQRTQAVASLFITGKDKGLLDMVPALRPVDPTSKLPLPFVANRKAADPEAEKRAIEEAARAAAARAEAEAKLRAAENLDEDVPF